MIFTNVPFKVIMKEYAIKVVGVLSLIAYMIIVYLTGELLYL